MLRSCSTSKVGTTEGLSVTEWKVLKHSKQWKFFFLQTR